MIIIQSFITKHINLIKDSLIYMRIQCYFYVTESNPINFIFKLRDFKMAQECKKMEKKSYNISQYYFSETFQACC